MGAGAIGSVVGGLLTKADHDVTLIDQWPAHVEAMKQHGLRLSGTCGDHVIPVRALHLCEAQGIGTPFDAIFLAVKSYDTEWATIFALRFLQEPDGVIVDFQNGVNDYRVANLAGAHRTLGAVILIGAGLYEPGHAIRTDTNPWGFKIGEQDGSDTPRARKLAEIMSTVAPSSVTTNLFGERWSKLAINAMANAVAGLSGYGSAEVRTNPVARRISIQIAAEAIRVARAAGFEVEPISGIPAQVYVDAAEGRGLAELEAKLEGVARNAGAGRPSLLQDVMRHRRTEVDFLNGYVAAQGRELGVPTPFNEAIVCEVHRHGVGTLEPRPENLAPLAAMLPA